MDRHSHNHQANASCELTFLSRDEELYPQLTRLYLDFDFRIVAFPEASREVSRRYAISYRAPHDAEARLVSPALGSLLELESYADDNIEEILQATLFAAADEP